jgi:cold-inducible RNA-binding protein
MHTVYIVTFQPRGRRTSRTVAAWNPINTRRIKLAKRIYVGNLPFSADEEQVRALFEQYGNVISVAMITDRETGRFRGFCFVEMDDDNADAAIEALNGYDMGGRALRINEAQPREERRGGGGGGGGGGGRRDGDRDRYDRGGSRGGDRDRDRDRRF